MLPTVRDVDGLALKATDPEVAGAMRRETLPCSVNLKALDRRFLSTCCSRRASVRMVGGSPPV